MPDASHRRITADALIDLFTSADPSGRVPGKVGRRRLAEILKAPAGERAEVMADPERHFGPFDDLQASCRSAILAAIRLRDAVWLRGRESGFLYRVLVRTLFGLRLRVHSWQADSRPATVARQLADALAFGARRAPSDLGRGLVRLRNRLSARFSTHPSLGALLDAGGIDVRPLAVCYARQVAQPDAQRGFWHDPSALQTVGVAAGIDFLPTEEGYRYVECNINFAQRAERSALYRTDPYVENLLEFAVEHGFQKLVIVDSAANGVDPATARRFEEGARKRGLGLTLVDRESVPRSAYARRYGMPSFETRDTLMVRTRSYPIALDYVADMKQASVRALERYLAVQQESDLLLPESGPEPLLGKVGAHEPFPNVVYKLPEIDQARGVYFLKADSPEHARNILGDAIRAAARGSLIARLEKLAGGQDGIFQAYYKSKMRPDRRLYIVRAHVLITPVGVQLLSAHQVISGRTVPHTLASGLIADPTPYMVNYSAGSWYEAVPASEVPAIARAAEAAGRGLAWAFQYGFRAG